MLIALSRTDGAEKWRTVVDTGNALHRKHNNTSPSPVTDGSHVWVVTGTGQVEISRGSEDGATPTSDSLGRDGFLAVEKRLSMDLDIDFEGRTWRDPGDCGNVGWTLSDNKLILDSTSWVELEDRDPKRLASESSPCSLCSGSAFTRD